jgi:hypothetical protein
MLEQLATSMDDTSYFRERIVKLSDPMHVAEMVANREADLFDELVRAEKNVHEEEERVAWRNKWTKALRDSVGPQPGAPVVVQAK